MPHVLACITPWALQVSTWLECRELEAVPKGMGMLHRIFGESNIPRVWSSTGLKEVSAWETWCHWRSVPHSTGWSCSAALSMVRINASSPYTRREDKGSVPQLAQWGNKASEGLARFHVPREAAHWPNGILTRHCISLGGMCEMRVLRISKDKTKSFFC